MGLEPYERQFDAKFKHINIMWCLFSETRTFPKGIFIRRSFLANMPGFIVFRFSTIMKQKPTFTTDDLVNVFAGIAATMDSCDSADGNYLLCVHVLYWGALNFLRSLFCLEF